MATAPDARSVHHRPHQPTRAGARLQAVPDPAPSDLYGPQHTEIERLIGAVRRISTDDDRAVERYWYNHRGAQRFAARGAASQVASAMGRLEAQIFARQQVWAASDNLSRDAAGDAAHALAVRDLIGETFPQQAYDELVAPWASVMGGVHPEDHADK
ncbi:hypothetical protein EK0264_05775 [Epidermidibacterium keratini]|uniref:Uncharacterized protein n=1 Tax=Epidermidibacterium keratini TaxID=1891644 RepID=A0A7L4YLA2_9ACTN|nr:hypothetical protein [Epidermidibacterium keratini]QHB99837.1 hypothetical protein EK0264_05775 [Epidermidibacterium keratini]